MDPLEFATSVKLGENHAELLSKILRVFRTAGDRKREQRGEPPHMVFEVGGVRLMIDEVEGEITQEELAAAMRAAVDALSAGGIPPTPGPIETWTSWNRRSQSWQVSRWAEVTDADPDGEVD